MYGALKNDRRAAYFLFCGNFSFRPVSEKNTGRHRAAGHRQKIEVGDSNYGQAATMPVGSLATNRAPAETGGRMVRDAQEILRGGVHRTDLEQRSGRHTSCHQYRST